MTTTSRSIALIVAASAAVPLAAIAGISTSTTMTTVTTTSTTTTLPPACADAPTLDSVQCRLGVLVARAGAEDLGRFGNRFQKNLMRATRLLGRAEDACRDDHRRSAKRQLKRLIRVLVRAGRVLRSRSARRHLEPAVRTELLGQTTDLVRDLKRARRILECPPVPVGSPSGAFV
jgi:hypothetical protein